MRRATVAPTRGRRRARGRRFVAAPAARLPIAADCRRSPAARRHSRGRRACATNRSMAACQAPRRARSGALTFNAQVLSSRIGRISRKPLTSNTSCTAPLRPQPGSGRSPVHEPSGRPPAPRAVPRWKYSPARQVQYQPRGSRRQAREHVGLEFCRIGAVELPLGQTTSASSMCSTYRFMPRRPPVMPIRSFQAWVTLGPRGSSRTRARR